jgi:gamma-glutamylcysteine synthetase
MVLGWPPLEDLNVILYQNMPNLHNRYISAERKISQEYMLNYSLPCMFPVIPTSNQDGRQAKNRKKGG